jgi:hypothetical protein
LQQSLADPLNLLVKQIELQQKMWRLSKDYTCTALLYENTPLKRSRDPSLDRWMYVIQILMGKDAALHGTPRKDMVLYRAVYIHLVEMQSNVRHCGTGTVHI